MSEVLAPLPVLRFCDNNGNALSGGLLFTYAAGTTTKQTTYTDSTGATPNTNPIVLNSRGECTCWLPPGLAFKFALSPSTDTDPPTNSFWTVDNVVVPPLITKATLSSASTVALGGAAADYVSISGTTTINAFDTVPAGTIVAVEFQGSLQLTYNATSLILLGAANITTGAGDTAVFVSEGSGNWRNLFYQRASGAPFITPVTPANGGTGVASPAAHAVMVAEGSSAMTPVSPGAAGQLLTSNGSSSDPSFQGAPAVVGQMRNLVGATPTSTTLKYTADEVVVEDTLGGTPSKVSFPSSGSGLTLTASTTGAGGMDTGSQPTSGFLAVYLIAKPGGASPALLGTVACSGSVYTGSNMPATYTQSALLGFWPCTTGPAFLTGTQQDRHFWYQSPVNIVTGVNQSSSLTSQSISGGVPAVAKTVDGIMGGTGTGSGSWQAVAADSTGTGIQQAVAAVSGSFMFGFGNAVPFLGLVIITAQTIYWANNIGGSTGRLSVSGFTF